MQSALLKGIPLLAVVLVLTSASTAQSAPQAPLLQLLKVHFGKLYRAEETLAKAAVSGETAYCADLAGDDKKIRGKLLAWLCTNPQATALLTYRGISINGATVTDEVDLQWARVTFPIQVSDSEFKGRIILNNAHIGFLSLSGGTVLRLEAILGDFKESVVLSSTFKAGVVLTGARIDGYLNCDGGHFTGDDKTLALDASDAEVKGSVFLRNGFIANGGVDLGSAKIEKNLECNDGQFIGTKERLAMDASDVRISGSVVFRKGFKANGGTDLTNARIEGNLNCDGGHFTGGDTTLALNANGAEVKGHLFMRNGFIADGGVDVKNARIEKNLECDDGSFVGKSDVLALDANSAQVKGSVFLRDGFIAIGGVNLVNLTDEGAVDCSNGLFVGNDNAEALNAAGARIGSVLYCQDGQFRGTRTAAAIVADITEVKGDIDLTGHFKAEEGVSLVRSKVGGNLNCEGAELTGNENTVALNADGIQVTGNVFLRTSCKAVGGVNLISAKIGRHLDCSAGKFAGDEQRSALNAAFADIDGNLNGSGSKFAGNEKVRALDAHASRIEGSVFLDAPFAVEGEVCFESAEIRGDIQSQGGKFVGKGEGPALNAESAEIKGSVLLRNHFKGNGWMAFAGAHVGSFFHCSDDGSRNSMILDMRHMKVETLINDRLGWPALQNLAIDGLVYNQIEDTVTPNATVELAWLDNQGKGQFHPQPSEQIADVLRKMGLEEDARKVMIAKNEKHAVDVEGQSEWLWYGLFGKLVGYGYDPWRAFFISLVVVGIGSVLFFTAYHTGLITPTSEAAYGTVKHSTHQLLESYPKFNSLVYSLETFVPLVKMGVGDHWMPNAKRGWWFGVGPVGFTAGGVFRVYYWCHIAAGWVLSALWVGALTGLAKT